MIAAFKKFISQLVQMDEDDLQAIANIMEPGKLQKKEHFVTTNEICNKILFFTEGYFRFYHVDINGNEIC